MKRGMPRLTSRRHNRVSRCILYGTAHNLPPPQLDPGRELHPGIYSHSSPIAGCSPVSRGDQRPSPSPHISSFSKFLRHVSSKYRRMPLTISHSPSVIAFWDAVRSQFVTIERKIQGKAKRRVAGLVVRQRSQYAHVPCSSSRLFSICEFVSRSR